MRLTEGGDTATPRNLELRYGLIKQHFGPKDFVLDVGCGRAEYVRMLQQRSPNAFGIETSTQKLTECFEAYPQSRSRVIEGSAEAIPFPDDSFDLVILNEVLEHVLDQDAALREIRRVLKPGGKLLLFCPNRLFLFETHGFMVGDSLKTWIPVIHYLPSLVLRLLRIESVARNYWPRQARRLLAKSGFAVQQRAFVQQTFENISGAQPGVVQVLRPAFRRAVRVLGTVPCLRALVSVSCFFVATSREGEIPAAAFHHPASNSERDIRLTA